jgi:molybdate transport system substrate-binding protein
VSSITLAATARGDTDRVRVYAAASLTEVVLGLAQRFDGARVVTSFGASSELARQIADGATADVFVSASPEWIDFLRESEDLDGEPVVLARNQIVCVAPKGSPLAARGVADPGTLLERLSKGDLVAIADAGVPAGEYARQALDHLGLLEAYHPRLVGQKDVRAVLHAVEQGEVPAGFVYATDARVAAVERLFTFDPASHPPIEYQAAALRGAANPAGARRFVAWLQSDTARALLSDAGFALP